MELNKIKKIIQKNEMVDFSANHLEVGHKQDFDGDGH